MYHRYAHMKDVPLVKKGDYVSRGQLIGYVGNTGNSSGPHLHWDCPKYKFDRWNEYTTGLSAREVRQRYHDPKIYLDLANGIPMYADKISSNYLVPMSADVLHSGLDLNRGAGWDDYGDELYAATDSIVEDVLNTPGWGHMLILKNAPMQVTGTRPSTLDPRDVQYDDVRPEEAEKKEWKIKYREQGAKSTCTAMAITNAAYALTGKLFSAGALYYEANEKYEDPGDKTRGLSIRGGLRTASNEGLILETNVPYGNPWNEDRDAAYKRWGEELRETRGRRTYFSYFRVPSYDQEAIDNCLHFKSPVIVAVDTFRGWDKGTPAGKNPKQDHALVLINKVNNDVYEAMDTLRYRGDDDDGIRLVHKSNIIEAWGITRDVVEREEAEATFYGKQRDFAAELKAQSDIVYAIGKIKRKDFLEEFTRNYELYTNAAAYGGYSVSEWIGPIWRPGDLMHYMHKKLDLQPPPFDITKAKK